MNKAVLAIRDILVRIRTSDYRNRASNYRIRIQLRIRLLSSVTLGMQKKISHNLAAGTLSSVLKIYFFAKILC